MTSGVVMGPPHPLSSWEELCKAAGMVPVGCPTGHPGGLPGAVEESVPELLLILLKISMCWSFPASSVDAQPFPF